MKIALVLVLAVCACADESTEKNESGRQKRLLFFDEDGALVKTYSNPYLSNLALKGDRFPYYGNILNPYFNFIQAFGNSVATITIPVSSAIVQQIQRDPAFQSSLVLVPKNPVVEPNPRCEGKRTQVPSPAFCNNFLNCWDGWAVEQECPTGLLFSSAGYCDYADNVDCLNRKVDEDKLQPQSQPTCNKDFEAFRNKLDCNEFFVCVNRQPVKFKCPADLSYSQVLGVCDYADRVDCKSTAPPAFPPYQPNFPFTITNLPLPQPVGPILIPQNPIIPEKPALLPQNPIIPEKPALLPQNLDLPQDSSLPQSVILPQDSALPESPSLPSVFPSFPDRFPSNPILPNPSHLAPGSPDIPVSPMIPPTSSNLRPSFIKPSPAAAPVDSLPAPSEKPGSGIFTPGCAPTNVAMSRQDAIRQLQSQVTY